MSTTLSKRAVRLMLPTNPTVDPDVDPAVVGETPVEYCNPVALNNRVVFLANAMIEGSDEVSRLIKQSRAAKLAKRKAERQFEDFEHRILRIHAAPKGASSLKALAAHIQKAAFEQDDTGTQYEELLAAVRKAEDEVADCEGQIAEIRVWLDAIEAAQTAITTHLSFVKAEINQTRRGGQRG